MHRIGMYIPGAGHSGPWRYVHSLLRGLDLAEFEVVLFCDLPGEYEPRPEVGVVRLSAGAAAPVPASKNGPAPEAPRRRSLAGALAPAAVRLWAGFGQQARRLAGVLRQRRVDLLHTNNTGCEESPVAARLAGVPRVVGTFHVDSTYDLHGVRSGLRHRLLEFVSNHCLDRGIGVSRATSRDWMRRTRLPRERVVTIYNGIDPAQFRRRQSPAAARAALGLPDDGRLIVGGMGRLEEAKGFSYLLDAVALLTPEHPDLVLAIAGRGPLQEDLRRQAERLGIAGRVRFLGFLADVQPVYDALDVFALPSVCETLGYVVLEAMATGLPVVGTSVGGVPEVIRPGATGFVVRPRDPRALAAGLRPLLASAELRRRLGQAGQERVAAQFTEEQMVRRTAELYRSLLRGAPRGSR